jgi:transcriptional regulator with XRE-family HTH domain
MDPRDLRQAFAANLRRLWHAKGISQENLAYQAGINRSYMSKLEKGASYPGLEIIAKLATVLECDPAGVPVADSKRLLQTCTHLADPQSHTS